MSINNRGGRGAREGKTSKDVVELDMRVMGLEKGMIMDRET